MLTFLVAESTWVGMQLFTVKQQQTNAFVPCRQKNPQIPYWNFASTLGVVNMFFIFFKVFHGSSVHVENLPFHPHLIIVTNLLRNGNYSEKR